MIYLLNTTEVYRADSEAQAQELINEAKQKYDVIKYNCERKDEKVKGEIVETWYKVTINKFFNEGKAPDSGIRVSYNTDEGEETSYELL